MIGDKAELGAKPVAARKRRAHKKVKTGCATCKYVPCAGLKGATGQPVLIAGDQDSKSAL